MNVRTRNNHNTEDGRIRIQHWKIIAAGLILYDAAAIAVAWFFGL